MKLPYPTATQIAATIGKMMAVLFVFAGLSIGNPFLMLIALFVWFGAEGRSSSGPGTIPAPWHPCRGRP